MIGADGTGATYVYHTVGSHPTGFEWSVERDPSLPTLTPMPTLTVTSTFTPTLSFGGGAGKILYNDGTEGSIYTYYELDLATLTERQIQLPQNIGPVFPHPDGQYFVGIYTYRQPNEPIIYKPVLINRADLSIAPIPNIEQGKDIALSHDGSQIAYIVENRLTNEFQLWIANLDGTNIRQISDRAAEPAWSPDGRRIAYQSGGGLHVIDLETLMDQLLVESGYYPAWSPDGQGIVYTVPFDGGYIWRIHIVNSDGSNPHPVTTDDEQSTMPAWSPDGSYIVFSRDGGVYRINPDGSELISMVSWGGSLTSGFTWEMPFDPSVPTFTPVHHCRC